jgi:lipopolysaccharide export system permease protein
MFLFLFQFLIKSIDRLVGKGLSIWVITKLISLNLAWILTLAVPMAVLVATLMAFGALSSNNEITIMKAGGVSLAKLMIPVLVVSGLLCYVMVWFNNDVLPEANHEARVLFGDISRTKPTLILESGKFSEDIGGAKILVQKTFPNTNKLEGIYIYDYSTPPIKNLFVAERGDISFSNDFKNVIMNLEQGEIHQVNMQNPSQKYRKIEFGKHRIVLDAQSFGFQTSDENLLTRGDRELSADSMSGIVDSFLVNKQRVMDNYLTMLERDVQSFASLDFKDTVYRMALMPDSITKPGMNSFNNNPGNMAKNLTGDSREIIPENERRDTSYSNAVYDSLVQIHRRLLNRVQAYEMTLKNQATLQQQADSYSVEIYKKFSIPFACIIFAMIGAPLGYKVKKGSFGIAAGLSLLFFLIYWASLIGGEKLADRGFITPFLGMWLANIVLGLFGLYLMFKSS